MMEECNKAAQFSILMLLSILKIFINFRIFSFYPYETLCKSMFCCVWLLYSPVYDIFSLFNMVYKVIQNNTGGPTDVTSLLFCTSILLWTLPSSSMMEFCSWAVWVYQGLWLAVLLTILCPSPEGSQRQVCMGARPQIEGGAFPCRHDWLVWTAFALKLHHQCQKPKQC